jgi:hypothetical protein
VVWESVAAPAEFARDIERNDVLACSNTPEDRIEVERMGVVWERDSDARKPGRIGLSALLKD